MTARDPTRPHQLRVRLALLTCLAASAIGVGGCDMLLPRATHGQYTVTLENHSPEPIIIRFLEQSWAMRPCSVRFDTIGCGPPVGQPKEVEVQDPKGSVLASWSVRGCNPSARSGFCNVVIQYSEQDDGGCPGDSRSQYILLLRNGQKRDLEVIVDGKNLGPLPAGGEARFGPLNGDWVDYALPEFRNSSGDLLAPGRDWSIADEVVEYDLGEVPVVQLLVGLGLARE